MTDWTNRDLIMLAHAFAADLDQGNARMLDKLGRAIKAPDSLIGTLHEIAKRLEKHHG